MFPSHMQKGTVLAFSGAFLLSFDTLLLRLIEGETLQIAFWRGVLMFVAGISTWSVVRIRGSKGLGLMNGLPGFYVAILYGLASIFFVASATMTSIANMLVIVATAPLWAAILAFVFFQEKTAIRTWRAFFAAFLGIVIVVWPGLSSGSNLGDVFALFTATCMAGAFVLSRRSQANLALAPAVGGIFSVAFLAPFVPDFSFQSFGRPDFLMIEGMILVPLALGLIAMAPRYIPATHVGLFLLLETVLGPTWIWIVIGEEPTLNAQIGGAIVIVALLAHSLFSIRSRSSLSS